MNKVSGEDIRRNIMAGVIGKSRNEAALKDRPHRVFKDMALVYEIELFYDCEERRCYSSKITNETAQMLDMDEEALFKAAMVNTPFRRRSVFGTLTDVLLKIAGPMPEDVASMFRESSPLYVLTNTRHLNGAAALLYPGTFGYLMDEMPDGCYVLPSSRHEMLILPKEKLPAVSGGIKSLSEMVRSINDLCLTDKDILSDEVFEITEETVKWECIPPRTERAS